MARDIIHTVDISTESLNDLRRSFQNQFNALDTIVTSNDHSRLFDQLIVFRWFLESNTILILHFLQEQAIPLTNHLLERSWRGRGKSHWESLITNTYNGCLKLIDSLIVLLASQAFNLNVPTNTDHVRTIWQSIIVPSFRELLLIWKTSTNVTRSSTFPTYPDVPDNEVPIIVPANSELNLKLIWLSEAIKQEIQKIMVLDTITV